MKITDKRRVLKLMAEVRKILMEEMRGHGDTTYARGLSSEGFAGGYMQALDDIDGALCHGYPSDHRGYWKEARRRMAGAEKAKRANRAHGEGTTFPKEER